MVSANSAAIAPAMRLGRPGSSVRLGSVPCSVVVEGFDERVAAALEVLDEIVTDRDLLQTLPLDVRTRLLSAAGDVYEPDVIRRRKQIKAQRREHKARRAELDQDALSETGIRSLRAKPVFTTPDAFAPLAIEPDRVVDDEILTPCPS